MRKIKVGIPLLSLIVVFMVALSMLNATQYARIRLRPTAVVTLKRALIRCMGGDVALDDTPPGVNYMIYSNNTSTQSNVYAIDLGNWLPGTTIVATFSFAIVNELGYAVTMKIIDVNVPTGAELRIWAHANATRDCSGIWASDPGLGNGSAGNTSKLLFDSTLTPQVRNYWNLSAGDGDYTKYMAVDRGWTNAISEVEWTSNWDATDNVSYYDSADDLDWPSDDDNYGAREETSYAQGSDYIWICLYITISETVAPPAYEEISQWYLSITLDFEDAPWTTPTLNAGDYGQ
jgi:hypothetical protein